MAEDAQPVLLDYLTKRYANLKLRLTRVLGNDDLAGDALHDAWLRLKSKDGDQGPVQSPGAYLVRMAVNIAVDTQRKHGRSLSYDDVNALLDVPDPTPGPAQTAEARSDVNALQKVLDEMPPRRREIIVLVHWEGMTQKEAAKHLGVSLRTIEYELKRAHDHLDAYMDAKQS